MVLVGDACPHRIPWAGPQVLPRGGEAHPMTTGPQGAAWLRGNPLRPWAPGSSGSSCEGMESACARRGVGRGAQDLLAGLGHGVLKKSFWGDPRGSPSLCPSAWPRRSLVADLCPDLQSIPKGHQLQWRPPDTGEEPLVRRELRLPPCAPQVPEDPSVFCLDRQPLLPVFWVGRVTP